MPKIREAWVRFPPVSFRVSKMSFFSASFIDIPTSIPRGPFTGFEFDSPTGSVATTVGAETFDVTEAVAEARSSLMVRLPICECIKRWCGKISFPLQSNIARSTTFSNSRTLPRQL